VNIEAGTKDWVHHSHHRNKERIGPETLLSLFLDGYKADHSVKKAEVYTQYEILSIDSSEARGETSGLRGARKDDVFWWKRLKERTRSARERNKWLKIPPLSILTHSRAECSVKPMYCERGGARPVTRGIKTRRNSQKERITPNIKKIDQRRDEKRTGSGSPSKNPQLATSTFFDFDVTREDFLTHMTSKTT
jgi:hypothetical protein